MRLERPALDKRAADVVDEDGIEIVDRYPFDLLLHDARAEGIAAADFGHAARGRSASWRRTCSAPAGK